MKQHVLRWRTVERYVSATDDVVGAVDVKVQVGTCGKYWYVRTRDVDSATDAAFPTEREALAYAADLAEVRHDGWGGETAAKYLARIRRDLDEEEGV